jgi:hypothetical protein
MKIFEREEMLINEGRKMELENTRKAELRAEMAEQKAISAEQRTKANDILELLQEHGTVPEWLTEKITQEQSMAVLKEWLRASAKADNIEDFLERTKINR